MSVSDTSQRILFVGFEGVLSLDLTGPADVLAIASRKRPGSYQTRFVGASPMVRASNGLVLGLEPLPAPAHGDTIIVPGGMRRDIDQVIADDRLMHWLKRASAVARRTVSVCSGALILAKLGLLDRRRCVTHWRVVDELAKIAPEAEVRADAIFVEDGTIWTSAGVTTGIDLALALVRRDHGEDLAVKVAKEIVVQIIRPGNQSQYSTPLALQKHAKGDLARLIPWLESRLSQATTVAQMAEAMGMSERRLHRHCVETFRRAPAKLALDLRLDHARTHLRNPSLPIAVIAELCGFSNREVFAKTFKKAFGVSPGAYRKTWAAASPSEAL
ncbi:MAG: helix-turn-helix domain-containing protein [Pseudomonadota bacterium]